MTRRVQSVVPLLLATAVGICPPAGLAQSEAPPPAAGAAGPTAAEPGAADPTAAEPGASALQGPPPSTYDLQQGRTQATQQETERTLLGQLVRTLLALMAVLALIFVFVKLALPRLFRTAMFLPSGGGSKALRVVERLQLDARHGLFLVELEGGKRLLLATGGEAGVRVVWQQAPSSPTEQVPEGFLGAMQEAARADEAAMAQHRERG